MPLRDWTRRLALSALIILGSSLPAATQLETLETERMRIIYVAPFQSYLAPYAARCFENSLAFQKKLFDWAIAQGADVIMQHTDSPAALQAAENAGALAFGQASNMAKFAPKAHLTAIEDNWAPYYIKRVQAALDGTWKSEDSWADIAAVSSSPSTSTKSKSSPTSSQHE